MLVLSRRVGEAINIGNNVIIHVVRVKGDRVRIGIEAPQDVNIDRAEIFKKKLENGEIQIVDDTE